MPREPESPSPDDIFDRMDVCVPYTAGELTDEFEDTSRWTVNRRLETLLEEGRIKKKKHDDNRVTWWIPA